MTYICPQCHHEAQKDAHYAMCKTCADAKRKQYRQDHPRVSDAVRRATQGFNPLSQEFLSRKL